VYEVDGTCNSERAPSKATTITGYENVSTNSEADLSKAVTNQYVSVLIEVYGHAFQFYNIGVITGIVVPI
jgi:cathepsin L